MKVYIEIHNSKCGIDKYNFNGVKLISYNPVIETLHLSNFESELKCYSHHDFSIDSIIKFYVEEI